MALYTFNDLSPAALFKSFTADAASTLLLKASVDAPLDEQFDIFLSHSYLDSREILTLKKDIEGMGFSVYVDWMDDAQLSRDRVTKDAATILRHRMDNSNCLLYIASSHSKHSKWMPWELGYFDAKKGRVAILPISDAPTTDFPSYHGLEYLGLYYYIDKCPPKGTLQPTV